MTPKTLMVPAVDARGEVVSVATTVAEWLDLTPEQDAMIKTQYALTVALRQHRRSAGITQAELAERLGTKQPRIAAMERGTTNTSIDLLMRALFSLGVSPSEVGSIIAAQACAAGVSDKK